MRDTVETPHWLHAATPEAEAHNHRVAKRLDGLIRADDREAALALVRDWPPADILSAMVRLKTKSARRLLDWLPEQLGLGVLFALDPRFSAVLAEPATVAKFRKLLRRVGRDRALEVLDGLPEEIAEALMEGHPEADALRAALSRAEDSAGYAMRHGLLTVLESQTVDHVIEAIRADYDRIARLERVFVTDRQRHLKGYLRLRDLLLAEPETPITAIMRPDTLAVTAETDRAEVLDLARARGRTDLAVTDREGRLIGSITAAELAEIARAEAQEDMLLMGGVSPASTAFDTPAQIVRRRLPWILLGLLGAFVSAAIIGSYEAELAEAAILASFIPVVMGTAGNTGIQAATVSIQAITGDGHWRGDFGGRVLREVAGAAGNGAIVGGLAAGCVLALAGALGLADPPALAATCLVALFLVILFAGTLGTLVPFALARLGLDPAVATGIFITTVNDMAAITLFFFVATALYL